MKHKKYTRFTLIFSAIMLIAAICAACALGAGATPPPIENSHAISGMPSFENIPDFDSATRTKMEVQIVGDGSIPPYSFDGLQPYFDQKGMTMFPMVHFNKLFEGNVSYEIDGNNAFSRVSI